MSQAIKWLNGNYEQPLRIDDLAKEVNLSVSTLHHRFKAITAMSPLQYQKQLRLQEARRSDDRRRAGSISGGVSGGV